MLTLALLTLSLTCLGALASPISSTNSTLERRAATVYSHCTTPNTVALTFDDGPWVYLNDIVNTLDAAGVKGTFFFNGNNFDCIYNNDAKARVKYAYDHGHLIGSHTWAHKDLTTLSRDDIHDAMWRVEQAVLRITGAYVAFMRPPYGSYNQLVLDVSGIRGQSVVIWDFDSKDSVGTSVQDSENLYNNVINQHPGTILPLNHEIIETTAHQVLPWVINRLKNAGYRLVSLDECLGLPAYQSVGSPQTPDSTWHC